MKSIVTTALAGLMLLGTIAGLAAVKNSNQKQPAMYADGGPAPLCFPQHCPPPEPITK